MKIYNNDCSVILDELIKNGTFVDCVITSPPYDNLRDYGDGFVKWDDSVWKPIIKQLYDVLNEGGVVVWVVADATIKGSETGTSFKHALHFVEVGFNLHDTMIYLKDNPVPVGGKNRYYQAFEYMFVFSKGKLKTFNPIFVERRNKHNDKRTYRNKAFNRTKEGTFVKRHYKFNNVVKKTNVWNYVVGGGNSVDYGVDHPATFPIELVEDHINSWTNELDTVLDPFMGSGTTGISCKLTNRNFIGIEINKEYFKLAETRINSTSTTPQTDNEPPLVE